MSEEILIETRCGDCHFYNKTCEIDSSRQYYFAMEGARLSLDKENNDAIIINGRKCRYFVPRDLPAFKDKTMEECVSAVKKLSALRLGVYIIDNNFDVDKVRAIVDKLRNKDNIINITIVTKQPGKYPVKEISDNKVSIMTIVALSEWHSIDNKIRKTSPDYYMVIEDEDADIVGNELSTLEYNVNVLCKRLAYIVADGFVIYNTAIHKMLGGNTHYPEGYEPGTLKEKLQQYFDKGGIGKELVVDWYSLEENPDES